MTRRKQRKIDSIHAKTAHRPIRTGGLLFPCAAELIFPYPHKYLDKIRSFPAIAHLNCEIFTNSFTRNPYLVRFIN